MRARHVGFVFQSFHLVPSLTAIENVMLPLELAGLPNARNSAAEVLAQVNLSPRREHYPRQLSGGEQQRVAIARAFVTRPAVLFADEPTGNLDSVTGERIIELLFDLNKATQTTLVVVTHDEAIAQTVQPDHQDRSGKVGVVIKALRLALLALLRDGKSGELRVLMLALLVAVSALTAVGFFTSRVSLAVDQQAGEVLAADLRLQSRTPIEREYFDLATAAGSDHRRDLDVPERRIQGRRQRAQCDSRRVRALSVARSPEGCRCAVRSGARSRLRCRAAGEAWLEPRLFGQLNARVGDRIRVGQTELTIAKVLDYRPDQGSQFVDLAPTLLMRLEDVPSTKLTQEGARISYAALFAGDTPNVTQFKEQLTARKKPGQRIVDVEEASPQIRSAIDRAEPLPQPGGAGHDSARRDRRRHHGAPLCVSSSRYRRADEEHGRLAAPRALRSACSSCWRSRSSPVCWAP